jgi:hypothetical protein
MDAWSWSSCVACFVAATGDGLERAPPTVNHRVSVPSALFAFWAQKDPQHWAGREPALPAAAAAAAGSHAMASRDASRQGRQAELRARVPRRSPRLTACVGARRV